MKRIIPILGLALLFAIANTTQAQVSVSESNKYAKKLLKKVKGGNFKKFQKNYDQALKDIAKIEADATASEFGYDAVADNIGAWISLNKTLAKFSGGKISFKEETITLQVKDYTALKTEAETKAAKAHFDAGVKIIEGTKDYATRTKAFEHFSKTYKYAPDYHEVYKDKIHEIKANVHYEEGVRILTSGKDFNEKVKAVAIFKEATKITKPYKDINDLCAKLYYDEGVRLATSNEIDDLKDALGHFKNARKWIADYKDSAEKAEAIRQKGAGIYYNKALAKEKEQTFEAQEDAAVLFKSADSWVKGYKDAVAKAEAAEKRAEVNILVCETNGNLIAPNAFSYKLQEATKDNFFTPSNLSAAQNIDLNKAANYAKAKQALGYGFILIKMGAVGEIKYIKPTTETSTEKIQKYFIHSKNEETGEWEISDATEFEYKAANAMLEKAPLDDYKTSKSNGTLTTVKQTTSASRSYTCEVWDARNPASPVKLGEVVRYVVKKDSKTNQSYTGDANAKPSSLKNDTQAIKTEQQLTSEINSEKLSVQGIVAKEIDNIAKFINDKVKYMP